MLNAVCERRQAQRKFIKRILFSGQKLEATRLARAVEGTSAQKPTKRWPRDSSNALVQN